MADKVYIVTGTSAGIGVGIAECLAKSGVKKLALVARRREKLEEVAASCKKLGATDVLVLPKDLSDASSCSQVVNETVAKFGSELNHCYLFRTMINNIVFSKELT